ncbi:MAG: heavy-metal-associated domain-containing protein [Lentisphaerae bacterium]|nr:heavy-metal-associated domain-containing protein [Lentisphaerota bacterium]
MRAKGSAETPLGNRDHADRALEPRSPQPAFAVLGMQPPCGGVEPPEDIKARLEAIPGVNAVRIDAERGKIHVLYDGTAAAINLVMNIVQKPGHPVRLFGGRRPLQLRVRPAEHSGQEFPVRMP